MKLDYLKNTVRDSIVNDIVNVAKYRSKQSNIHSGWFSIPREVFCFIDFLGAVSYNNKNGEEGASTRKAVRFINEYFPKHYKPYADLLVAIWRHGTVHNFAPSQFYAVQGNKKTIIKWTSNRSNAKHNRAVNLRTFNKKNSLNIIYLSINIFQLADDLLYAFDRLIEKIDGQSSFANGCLRRLNRLFKMKNCMSLKRIGNTKKRQLKNQILTAKSSTIGTLDDHLQVEYY